MRVFVLWLFSEIRKEDEVIGRANIHCFALLAQTGRLSEPECRFNGEVNSIFRDSRPTVIYVVRRIIISRTRKCPCTVGNC